MSIFLLRFRAVPLRHKIIAASIAVAIAGGVYVVLKRGMTKSATTASLSFDPAVARQIEPGALEGNEPAVALALSILSDDMVKVVSKQAGISFSAEKNDVTEFRSRLEITQPSAKTLRVSYHDPDQKKSTTAANTVAIILAAWTPFPVVEPPPVAVPQPTASPVRPSELDRHRHHASPHLSNSLRELEARLSANDQKIASLSAEQASGSHKANADSSPSNAQSEHRRLLQVQLSAEEKRLSDLRVRYTDEYPDVETAKENIAEIQRQLASLPPVSNESVLTANPKASETIAAEIGELRQDRLRLVHAIATEERREVMLRETALSMQGPGATVQTVSLSQPQQAPTPVSENPPGLSLENPFRLVRLAAFDRKSLSWPGPLSGFLCGFLYLGIAMWRYQPGEGGNPDAPGKMKMVSAPTFQELPPAGILSESNTGGLKRVSVIVENDTSVDLDKAPVIHRPEAEPPPVNASEGEGPRGKLEKKWEKIVRETLAQSSVSRPLEILNRNDEARTLNNQKQAYSESSKPREPLGRNLRDLGEVVRDNILDSDIWMTHSKAAQLALEKNDLDTAIKEIKLAIAVAPGTLKTWLGDFLVQLEKDRRRLPEATHREIHRGEVLENTANHRETVPGSTIKRREEVAGNAAKPREEGAESAVKPNVEGAESTPPKAGVRVNVIGLHPILGRLAGPPDDAFRSDK